jgi:hypothetical protein
MSGVINSPLPVLVLLVIYSEKKYSKRKNSNKNAIKVSIRRFWETIYKAEIPKVEFQTILL